tara:strand:- start:1686 stop:2564 length:879 start_codon:yes stop_codon:yes gene_type:complete
MLKLLLVGYGNMGKVHEKAIKNSDKAEIYGIVDPKVFELKMKGLLSEDINFVDLNNGIDGVIISSTTKTHYSIAMKTIENKIPTFIEKPISTSIKEVEELTNICLNENIILQTGLIENFNPVIIYLKKENLNLTKEINIIRTSPPLDKKRELENVIHDLGIHDIGIFDYIYNLKNPSLINKSLFEINGMIAEADITFLSNDIKINLKLSNIAKEKRRTWEIIGKDFLYNIDLLKKEIIKNDNGNEERKIFEKSYQPIDLQLDDFIKKIKDKSVDKEHIVKTLNIHKFIDSIL